MRGEDYPGGTYITSARANVSPNGAHFEIEVERFPEGWRAPAPRPKASDLPLDVREALQDWLEAP